MDERARDKIRVLVVEDQPKILKNQLKLLDAAEEIEIVGTAMNGETAIDEIPRCNPDVLLLDLGLPRMSGIDVTREVKARWPKVEILIFTIFDEEGKVLEAIRDVCAGGTIIQPSLARNLLKHFRAGADPAQPSAAPDAADLGMRPLSDREREILQLIAKGISNSEAAHVLNLSKATIRTHLEHIYQKLDVTNRVEAVTEGIRKGLIDVSS